MISPTRSLFLIAENARSAQSSTAISPFIWCTVPNSPEELASTMSITVNSRSSSNIFTNGCPIRAVTFQSTVRTSSPGWYSRTSANSIPLPLNTEWYSPEKTVSTRFRVRISMRRTFLRISLGIIYDLGLRIGNHRSGIQSMRIEEQRSRKSKAASRDLNTRTPVTTGHSIYDGFSIRNPQSQIPYGTST